MHCRLMGWSLTQANLRSCCATVAPLSRHGYADTLYTRTTETASVFEVLVARCMRSRSRTSIPILAYAYHIILSPNMQ